MKKILLNILCLFVSIPCLLAQSFTGNASYNNAQGEAWHGISVICNVSIWVESTTGGLGFEHKLNNIDVVKLRTRKQDIPYIQIPQNVINAIKTNGRANVEWDLYDGNVFISRMDRGRSISWDRLLRLPASEHYKQSTTDNGYKLYKSGSLNIRNVKITSFNYAASSAVQNYLSQMDIQLTSANKPAAMGGGSTSAGNPSKNSGSTEVFINGQAGGSASSASATAGSSESSSAGQNSSSGNRTTSATPKPWTQSQVNDYLERGAASRQAQEAAITQKTAATMNVINAVGNYLVEKAEQKRAADERAFEAEFAAEEEKIARQRAENAQKEQFRTNRTALVTSFNGGKVPLSSQKVTADEIYFFCFSYDQTAIENPNMKMYVSNVFPITRYGDGTWPFTTTLLDNIARANNGAKVELSGFYTSSQDAEQKRQEFIEGINDLSLTQGVLTYKGKKASGSESTDFWGNAKQPVKQPEVKVADKKPETETKAETDFWGNPVKTEQKKTDGADFWGEPLKQNTEKTTTAPKDIPAKKN